MIAIMIDLTTSRFSSFTKIKIKNLWRFFWRYKILTAEKLMNTIFSRTRRDERGYEKSSKYSLEKKKYCKISTLISLRITS